ncbi:hypothetical protein FE236_12465 [Mariprofundus erugo]|uniref:DUF2007 domain-containing protein n=1 Tax=Mariprofundus erugo TaxID=2528639 RepID=A0A5R9GMU3_9PROT|nr:DUF6164 family protein [Mariprofundus erugo]TLS67350.1 hypothetical protein FEF65_07955 [Mariprofundus erugo]TLS73954.1 hypothetical protein FE236_12465 [Mariprofundus erugo]
MAELLFRLRGVPDDEIDDIRGLLDRHDIDFYETTAGSWGISLAAIWLHDHDRLDEAKGLIDAYQQQRAIQARQAYEQLKQRGEHKRLWQGIAAHPFRFLLMLGLMAFTLYVTLSPFIHFG